MLCKCQRFHRGTRWERFQASTGEAHNCVPSADLPTCCLALRSKAKKALLSLAQEFPGSPLPNRYLARFLYHEAATIEAVDPSALFSGRRLQLLREALENAEKASDICPSSLSCAALRATLVLNVLVENSVLAPGGLGGTRAEVLNGQQGEALKKQFKAAVDTCSRVLTMPQPVVDEPVIAITTGNQKTFDPCSLDKVQALIKAGKWDKVFLEKIEVLLSMRQVLETCYDMLEKTSAPMDGMTLQNILRPHQQELRAWAENLVLGRPQSEESDRKASNTDVVRAGRAQEQRAAAQAVPQQLQPQLPPADAPQSSLSMERDWSNLKESGTLRSRRGRTRGHERRSERSLQDRYNGVVQHWTELSPGQRRHLLSVPMQSMLEVVKSEHGGEVAREMVEGLVIMREADAQRPCYWTCPACSHSKFESAKGFLDHVEQMHEEVQMLDASTPISCHQCHHEVVGLYFSHGVLGEPLRPTATYGYFPDPQQAHTQAQAASAYAQLQATSGLSSQQLAAQQQMPAPLHYPAMNGGDSASMARGTQQQQQYPGYAANSFPQQHQQQAALTRLLQQMNGNPHTAATSAQAASAAASAAAAAAQLQASGWLLGEHGVHPGMRTSQQLAVAAQRQQPRSANGPLLERRASTGSRSQNLNGSLPPPQPSSRRSQDEGLSQASTTTELGEEADSTEGSASWRTFLPKQFRQWQTAAASRLPSLLTTSQQPQSSQPGQPQQQQQPGSAQSLPQPGRQTESLPGTPPGMTAGQRSGPARLWEQAKRQASRERQPGQIDAPATPSSASDATGMHGSVEEMAPTYSVPMPPNQDASFNEFVRSLDANGLDAASLGHVGIMDEVASPGNFMNAPGQPELQAVQAIMNCVTTLWKLDSTKFEAVLAPLVTRAAYLLRQRAATGAGQRSQLGAVVLQQLLEGLRDASSVVARPDCLQAALGHLAMPELQELMAYLHGRCPAAASAAMTMPTAPRTTQADGVSSSGDLADLDVEEDFHVPPLFQLASPVDEARLKDAAEDVLMLPETSRLSREQEGDNARQMVQTPSMPRLVVASWWLDHLHEKGVEESRADAANELRLLRWIYGKVVNVAAEAFCDRQRELLGTRDRDPVIMDMYEEIAGIWRQMYALGERKRALSGLRNAARESFQAVKQQEDRGCGSVKGPASEYLHAVMPSYYQSGGGNKAAPLRAAEAALKANNYTCLTSSESMRYARALVSREITALDLQEAMLSQEIDEASAEEANAEAGVSRATEEVSEAEAELSRVQMEGPANHRKRDPIDKATKEAEHRERLSELKTRIDSGKDRLATEESSRRAAKDRIENANSDLGAVRDHLHSMAQRRMQLDLTASDPEPSKTALGLDHPNMERLCCRVLWVAEAVARYADQYTPGKNNIPYERFMRACQMAKGMADEYELTWRRFWDDLDKLRSKLQEVACIDLTVDITNAALEVVRQQIESAAWNAAKVLSDKLLLEEEEAQKVAAGKALMAAKRQKPKKAKPRAEKEKIKPSQAKDGGLSLEDSADEEVRLQQVAVESARREAEYEAALEQRRLEVEAEQTMLEIQQAQLMAGLLDPVTPTDAVPSLPESTTDAGQEEPSSVDYSRTPSETVQGDEGSSVADTAMMAPSKDGDSLQEASSVAQAVTDGDLMDDAEFDAATRAAILASLQEMGGGAASQDWQDVGKDGVSAEDAKDKKKKSRRQRAKENKDKDGKEVMPPKDQTRIVSYYGDWLCNCGTKNRLWDACACGQANPCRDWVRGRCKYATCRFLHPPFDLPAGPIPASPIARPAFDAPLWPGSTKPPPNMMGPAPGGPQARAAPKPKTAGRPEPSGAAAPFRPSIEDFEPALSPLVKSPEPESPPSGSISDPLASAPSKPGSDAAFAAVGAERQVSSPLAPPPAGATPLAFAAPAAATQADIPLYSVWGHAAPSASAAPERPASRSGVTSPEAASPMAGSSLWGGGDRITYPSIELPASNAASLPSAHPFASAIPSADSGKSTGTSHPTAAYPTDPRRFAVGEAPERLQQGQAPAALATASLGVTRHNSLDSVGASSILSAPEPQSAVNWGHAGRQKDTVVPAPLPRRTPSASRLPSLASSQGSGPEHSAGWAEMSRWGQGQPGQTCLFDPFGGNPIQRALASDYRLDPVHNPGSTARPVQPPAGSRGSGAPGSSAASTSALGLDMNGGTGHQWGGSASDSFAILDSLLTSSQPSLMSLHSRSPPSLGITSSRPLNGRVQQGSMLGSRQSGLDGSVPLQQDTNPFGQLGGLPYPPVQAPGQSAFSAAPPQPQRGQGRRAPSDWSLMPGGAALRRGGLQNGGSLYGLGGLPGFQGNPMGGLQGSGAAAPGGPTGQRGQWNSRNRDSPQTSQHDATAAKPVYAGSNPFEATYFAAQPNVHRQGGH
ncbi:hypothetical protein WJX84_007033 [Apatococcus fuscideae]|uniref:C3H1-type domain-containing protein n=1 Tax=Apatococcus fuscideae TaxID=2026836 RepID=A0AAW1T599_9CHLO